MAGGRCDTLAAMDRRWLAWLAVGTCLGCTPGIDVAEDTEGDSETGTGTSTGDAGMTAASVSASSPSSQTAASMSASGSNEDDGPDDADDDGMTTAMTTNVDPDSTGPAVTDDAADEPPCPPGELDCPCDVGSACDGDLMCVEGVCVAEPACEEPEGEPNDDEASAIDQGDLSCGADAMTIDGAFDGADMDWYTTVPMGGGICFGSPSASVEVDGDAEVTVCMYAVCNDGGTNVGCGFGPGAGMPDTSPDGADGCCGGSSVDLDSVSCQSLDQSYVAWVRVSTAQEECLPYTLTLEY
jgi:hypothetical protein